MNRKLTSLVAVVVIISALIVLGVATKKKNISDPGKVSVTASFYPLAHFAEQVGGNLISVTTITPSGVEPHDFEPSPQDIATIHNSKLLLYNGNTLDAWADRINEEVQASGVSTVKMADKLQSIEGTVEEEKGPDPHFWLDPTNAKLEVAAIRDALSAIDPDHADQYASNAAAYIAKLNILDTAFSTGLTTCDTRTFITGHAAFGYLSKSYGLTMLPIAGISPEEEPSASDLAKLSQLAKQEKIKYVFTETLASPRLAETIAQETGAQTLVLNPIEGLTNEEIVAGENYVSIMEKNLTNLRIALGCR